MSLLLKEEGSGKLKFEVVVGIEKEALKDVRIAFGEGVAGIVAETGKPIFLEDAKDDPRVNREVDKQTGFKTESIICIPLKVHGNVLGVIEVINVQDFEEFKSKELPVLEIFADYAAIALENSQYFSKIQQMSVTDEYTGLYNARYLHSVLEGMIKNSLEGDKLAVVFVDVDNFKEVVDTFGHLSGSQVLKEIGMTISNHLSDTDTLIKYGGDEYVIMLPKRDKEGASGLVEKILQSIREEDYLKSEAKSLKITASCGIAIYPDDAQTKKDILITADNMMYKVKKSTKNAVGTT